MPQRQKDRDLGTLGRYQLLRRIAVGGMGELFLARASSFGGFEKLVAIKRILPILAEQPAFVAMFLDEARVAATLEHPNIVHVADLGHAGKDYFLVMPYLEGGDLAHLRRQLTARRRALPEALAVHIVTGVASGLDYAHAKRDRDGRLMGLVHRDVSPENIFVTFEGEVKLLDFGIARAAQVASHTDVGTRRGKARYMSPEQARGQPLDARSDIFALGVVLYELTTGALPFDAENDLAVLARIVAGAPLPPSQRIAGYPRSLEAIVMRALEVDPARRFQSAAELRDALRQHSRERQEMSSSVELGAFVIDVLAGESADGASHDERSSGSALPPPPMTGALQTAPPPSDRRASPATATSSSAAPTTGVPDARRRWPVVAIATLGVAVVVGAFAYAVSRAPTETAASAASNAEQPPPGEAFTDAQLQQLLAMVNTSSLAGNLAFDERTEALRQLRASGWGERIDEPLQHALDLLQANQSSRPCATFDAALTIIEQVPIGYFADALAQATVPNAGLSDRDCHDLEARRLSALALARAATR